MSATILPDDPQAFIASCEANKALLTRAAHAFNKVLGGAGAIRYSEGDEMCDYDLDAALEVLRVFADVWPPTHSTFQLKDPTPKAVAWDEPMDGLGDGELADNLDALVRLMQSERVFIEADTRIVGIMYRSVAEAAARLHLSDPIENPAEQAEDPPRIDLWDDESHTAYLRGPQAEDPIRARVVRVFEELKKDDGLTPKAESDLFDSAVQWVEQAVMGAIDGES